MNKRYQSNARRLSEDGFRDDSELFFSDELPRGAQVKAIRQDWDRLMNRPLFISSSYPDHLKRELTDAFLAVLGEDRVSSDPGTEGCVPVLYLYDGCWQKNEKTASGNSGMRTFYFMPAKEVLAWSQATIPRMQELQRVLIRKEIDLSAAMRGEGTDDILFVSHRWESSTKPDLDGVQLAAVKDYLVEHRNVAWVWYDYWFASSKSNRPHLHLRQPRVVPFAGACRRGRPMRTTIATRPR